MANPQYPGSTSHLRSPGLPQLSGLLLPGCAPAAGTTCRRRAPVIAGEGAPSPRSPSAPRDVPARRGVPGCVSAATENASTWPSCPSPDGLWSTWRRNGDALRAKATAAWLEANPRFHPHHTPAHARWFSILSRWLLKRGEFGRRADRQDHRLHRRRNRRAKAVRRVPAQRLNYTRVISARRQHTRFRCDGLANWPEASRKAAQIVIDRPGPPREATGSLLIWEQVGEWKRLMPLKLFIDVRAS